MRGHQGTGYEEHHEKSQYCSFAHEREHTLNTVCGAAAPTRHVTTARSLPSRAQLISGGRGTGARRGCRRPLGGPARSDATELAAAVSPGRSDGLLGGLVEVVGEKPARAEGRAGHPGARPQERALGIGSRAASAHRSLVRVVLALRVRAVRLGLAMATAKLLPLGLVLLKQMMIILLYCLNLAVQMAV